MAIFEALVTKITHELGFLSNCFEYLPIYTFILQFSLRAYILLELLLKIYCFSFLFQRFLPPDFPKNFIFYIEYFLI